MNAHIIAHVCLFFATVAKVFDPYSALATIAIAGAYLGLAVSDLSHRKNKKRNE